MIGLILATCIAAHDCNYDVLDTFPTMTDCVITREAFVKDEKIPARDAKAFWCDELKNVPTDR